MWNFSFISLFSILTQVQSLYQIKTVRLEENQSYQGLLSSKIVFESNQSQFQYIEIDFQVIKEVFTIEKFNQGQLIHLVFLNTFNFQNQILFCACQLLLSNTSYFIVCIDGVENFQNEVEFKLMKNVKKYYIDLQTEIDEVCEKLFIDSENQLIVYCQSLTKLKIHKINLKEQTTILLKQFEQITTINCKYKFINIDQITILAFYNCQDWKLMKITEDKLETILNSLLLKTLSINSLQISNLTEIFTCQDQFYLIDRENYLVLKFFNSKFSHYDQFHGTYEIFSIKFSFMCLVDYMIVLDDQQSRQRVKFNENQRQVVINKSLQLDIYGLDQFILLRNNNYLNIIFCEFLNQTIEIQSSKLYFIDNQIQFNNIDIYFPQLFYQIDKNQQKASFYQYFNLPKIIKPTKKYLFSVENFNIFTIRNYQEVIIQEIIYEHDKLNKIDSYKESVFNDCNKNISVRFKKNQLDFPENYEILFQQQQNESILDIFDEIDYYQLLPHMIKQSIRKILHTGNIEKQGVTSTIYIYQDNIYFYNSQQNRIVYQRFIDKSIVLHTFGFIMAINFQMNQMFILVPTTSDTIEKTEYFNQSISKVTQSNNFLIIQFIDQSFWIYNVPNMKEIYLQQEIKQLGIPLYYSANNVIQIIQYENFVLLKTRKYQKIIKLENVLIYSTLQNNQEIYIKSIHNIDDKLIIFYFDGYQLIVVEEHIVDEGKFLRPLKFEHENDFISIASTTNQDKSICTFFVKNFIKLINVKYCHNHNFTLSQAFLIYFNLNNQLKLFNLNFITITLKNSEQQNTYYDQFLIQIKIRYKHKNQLLQLHKTLQVLVFNFCYQIYPKQKSIKITDTAQIQLENLFQGPISEISFQDEIAQEIVSPFKKKQSIQDCSKLIIQNCFVFYQIIYKSTEDYFQYFYLKEFKHYRIQANHETKLRIIKNGLINNSTFLLNILTNKEKIYLHYFKIEHEKHQLIEINLIKFDDININLKELEVKFRDPFVLIQIREKLEKQYIFILFQEQNYIIYPIAQDQEIIDIFKISDDKYLKLYYFQNKEIFELFQVVNDKLVIIFNFILLNSEFENILEQIYVYHQDLYQFKKTILNCSLLDNILVINLFSIFNQFSSEVQIIYNIQNGKKQFKLLKMIRNPYRSISIDFYYSDSQFLILQSMQSFHYLYDLRRNQIFFDHFAQLDFNPKLFQFNTTHYIISIQNNYVVGEIGYEFEFLENYNQSAEKFNIIAKNSVFSAELEIVIMITSEKDLFSIQLLLVLILFLLILICFIRRTNLKLKFKSRQIFQSKSQNSDVEISHCLKNCN